MVRRVAWTLIAVLIGIPIGYLVRKAREEPKVVSVSYEQVPAEQASAIAAAFRPILSFDSDEPWRAIAISAFVAEEFEGGARHQVCVTHLEVARRDNLART